jgi:hypothetical protein
MSAIETETEKATPPSRLETWAQNESMRHVPSLEWILWKLDVDLRHRLELMTGPCRTLPFDHPHRAETDTELLSLCRAIERLAEAAKHLRNSGHPPQDLGSRVTWSLNHALASLNSLDGSLFGRRYPVQTHERSKAEPVYGALLVVIQHADRLLQRVRAIDPGIDEKLLKDLVVLEHPVNEQTLKPIA